MFSLYVLGTLEKSNDEYADFYEKDLYPEVKDRVANKTAAVAGEQCRMIGDSQPPLGFSQYLQIPRKIRCCLCSEPLYLLSYWMVEGE